MIERHGEELPHSAIRMDSQYPDVLAAVVTARAAGMAAAAAQIGLDSAGIACREPSVVWRSLNNLHSQFVAKHTRVSKERLTAMEGVKVRATNAHAADAYQGLACAGGGRSSVGWYQSSRLLKHNLSHEEAPLLQSVAGWAARHSPSAA